MCLFNNWQGLGTGNSSANNNFIDWGCTGACTSHGHISAMKPRGARGFMSPNCTTASRAWKSRNEPFKIIKERRELLFLFLFLLFPSLHWLCSQHWAGTGMHRESQNSNSCINPSCTCPFLPKLSVLSDRRGTGKPSLLGQSSQLERLAFPGREGKAGKSQPPTPLAPQ